MRTDLSLETSDCVCVGNRPTVRSARFPSEGTLEFVTSRGILRKRDGVEAGDTQSPTSEGRQSTAVVKHTATNGNMAIDGIRACLCVSRWRVRQTWQRAIYGPDYIH